MKKLVLIYLVYAALCGFIPCASFAVGTGDVFVVKKGKYVPLFVSEGTSFEYEVGKHGTNCYDLDTVLPRGSFVKVIDVRGDVVHVSCKVSENYSSDGFIHRKFFDHSMKSIESSSFDSIVPNRAIPSLDEISGIFDSLLDDRVPFAWGCNNLQEVNLKGMYEFTSKDGKRNIPYRCAGLDCSGLLHMISSWVLPHATGQLYNFSKGKCICELDADSSDGELKDALAQMLDTDFVVFVRRSPSGSEGHVIVYFRGGFIEAKGCNSGVIYTDEDGAIEKLRTMTKKGKVRVIRWHPELLGVTSR
ncbi:MAG: hypothetical protein LBB15_01265 [Puniceicoccales bacterium]|nr:hypothetical protein [Puniceicoccales bacterium]